MDMTEPVVSPQIVGKTTGSESISLPTPYDQETHSEHGKHKISLETLDPYKPNLPHHSGRGGRRRRRGTLIPRTKENTKDKTDTTPTEFPRNFIIKSPEDVNLSRIDTVTAHKELIQALNGKPKSITETRKGTLLVQTLNRQQSQNIMNITKLADTEVTVILNDHMNKTKGIINYDNLPGYSTQQLVEALSEFKVTDAYQIKKRNSNNNTSETSLYILTFNTLKLPENVQVGWTNCRVRAYIPRPRRCYKCHRYGHGALNCRSTETICSNCGNSAHGECNMSPKCINCGGDHPVFATDCPTYRYEEEIIATQIRENITFKEAKSLVSQRYVRPRRAFSEIVQQQQPQTSRINNQAPPQQHREQTPAIMQPIEKSPPVIITPYNLKAPPKDFQPNPVDFATTRNRFAVLSETENNQNQNISEHPSQSTKKRPKEISPEHTMTKKACHDSELTNHLTTTTTENKTKENQPPPNYQQTEHHRSRSRENRTNQSQRTHKEKPKTTEQNTERRPSEPSSSSSTLERNMRFTKPIQERRTSSISSTDAIRFKIPFRKPLEKFQKPK